jgi:hypothetical protein
MQGPNKGNEPLLQAITEAHVHFVDGRDKAFDSVFRSLITMFFYTFFRISCSPSFSNVVWI